VSVSVLTCLVLTGSTALIAVIEGTRLIVANVGDSRGVMCDAKGNAIPLSFDHKPQQVGITIWSLHKKLNAKKVLYINTFNTGAHSTWIKYRFNHTTNWGDFATLSLLLMHIFQALLLQ
jgi:hypothetical protein